ncbi:ParB/RepB/Spo0J family partition protein [uncultured Ruminococcus sp.]|uniref:ParB/RepB/Spo0J family partition protein n=1 Tax=uncultured Ruminococcus sp. TaxID=165186 RepID=UPI00262ED2AA|nr:ParB/RepB/Spo0J family partition protein [uncultured Ruminococcus sp.]
MQTEADNINHELAAEYLNQWQGNTQRIADIDINKIRPYITPEGKEQPYKIRHSKVERLAISIKDLGVLQPIIVRKKGNDYEILAGHHRYYAAKVCGLQTVPCQIKDNIDDFTAYMIVAESNTRTDEVLPSENAEIFKTYMDKRGKANETATLREISEKFGVSDTTVYRYVHLLKLNSRLVPLVDSKIIPFGRYEMLLTHLSEEEQYVVADYIEMYDIKKFSGRYIKDICAYCNEIEHKPLTVETVFKICQKPKAENKPVETIYTKIAAMFPSLENSSQEEMDDLIVKLIAQQFE